MITRLERTAGFALLLLVACAEAEVTHPKGEAATVPMRDGIPLAADLYFPPDTTGPWPAVLMRTPYNKQGLRDSSRSYTENGFVFVAQDCRGRFGSEGDYVPFRTDREDGYDTVEWIAAQPWCDGNVGVAGGSAGGITALQCAMSAPPHLKAAYVIVAPTSWRREALWMGGIYRKRMIDGWMSMQGATESRKDWTRRAIYDPYFDYMEVDLAFDRIEVPVWHLGGWFDIFQQGTLDAFTGMESGGGEGARGRQKLTMAALAHGPLGSRWKDYPDGGGSLGAGEVRWFERWLKGIENGVDTEPPVRWFLMGDPEAGDAPGNFWVASDSWPPPAEETAWYLHPGGGLSPVPPAAGEAEEPASEYLYDPENPAPTVGGANLILDRGPMDQREIGERPDYLRFAGEPLDAPVTVAGRVRASLFVRTDAPDTDFIVKLIDVFPDGYEAVLLDAGLRLRYREGLDQVLTARPDEVYEIGIDLWSTAYVFAAGHRIGVHVTSSSDPRFDPNPNTGKPLRADDETRPARNAILHDAERPSRLLLPVADYDALAAARE